MFVDAENGVERVQSGRTGAPGAPLGPLIDECAEMVLHAQRTTAESVRCSRTAVNLQRGNVHQDTDDAIDRVRVPAAWISAAPYAGRQAALVNRSDRYARAR